MAEKWNKMVEAFMRAMNRPDVRNNLSRFGKTGRQERQDLNKFNDRLAKKADEIAPTEALQGWEHGDDDAADVAIEASVKRPDGTPDEMDKLQKEFDAKTEERMDANLKRDFERAFDEAAENHGYKKWKEESKDMPVDDGFKGDLHDINREDAVQRSREEIIKALQQNTDRDVTDVLRDFGYIIEE